MEEIQNPSAFPVNDANLGGAGAYAAEPGMTLRDYFAGQALAGLLAAKAGFGPILQGNPGAIAEACHEYADAMLTTRAEPLS